MPAASKLRLEFIEAAEGGLEVVGEFAGGCAAGAGSENFPEEGMVPVSTAVITNRAADGVGYGAQILDDLFEGLGFEGGIAGDGLVEIVHIGLVMLLAVMDFHGGLVKMRFECVSRVGERREFVCHRFAFIIVGSPNRVRKIASPADKMQVRRTFAHQVKYGAGIQTTKQPRFSATVITARAPE